MAQWGACASLGGTKHGRRYFVLQKRHGIQKLALLVFLADDEHRVLVATRSPDEAEFKRHNIRVGKVDGEMPKLGAPIQFQRRGEGCPIRYHPLRTGRTLPKAWQWLQVRYVGRPARQHFTYASRTLVYALVHPQNALIIPCEKTTTQSERHIQNTADWGIHGYC